MTNYRTKKGKEQLEKMVNEYFSLCDRLNREAEKEKKLQKPYTLSGLLSYLDISEVELSELASHRSAARVINSAKRRIEAFIEENALNGRLSSTAAINSLKERFGWGAKNDEDMPSGFEITMDSETDRLGI